MRRLLALRGLVAVAAVAAGVAGPGAVGGAAAPAGAATGPCGSMAGQPASIKHVVIIMDENQSYSAVIGSSAAPNINAYANECGVATKYWAITHPSHSDYIATVAGNTYVPPGCTSWTCVTQPLDFCGGTTGTNGTATCPSIFAQLDAAGVSWKVYAESMPTNCSVNAASPYSAGHNPAVWFIQGTGSNNIATSCAKNDVPLTSATVGLQHDITANSLPEYSWIVPNKCDDMHNCSSGNPVTAGDTFAKTWIDKIVATPDYQNGNTIIFLTWDEGVEGGRPFNEDCLSGSGLTDESCHVPLIAISPYIAAGSKPGSFSTHYGLLKATERLTGLTTFIGHAGDAGVGDLLAGFGLQLGGGGGDTTPPTPPNNLVATATGSTTVHLTWGAASDNVGVTNSAIYRGGTRVATIGNRLGYDDSGLQPATNYSYTVTALDAAGNESQASNTASVTTDPGGGSTVFADGFESGNLSLWPHVIGAVKVENTNVDTGSYAADVAPKGSPAWAWTPIAAHTDLTYEVDFKVNSKTSSSANLIQFRQAAGKPILTVSLNGATNRLRIVNGAAATTVTSTTAVTAGIWHHLLVQLVIGASGQTSVSLDGTDVAALHRTWNTGTTPIGRISFGDANKSRTFTIAFDNVNVHT